MNEHLEEDFSRRTRPTCNESGGGRRMTGRLVEAVEEDTSLEPEEKETAIRFLKVDGRASVYTEEAGLMRRLLRHPHFEVDSFRVNTDDTVGKQVAPNDFEEGSITGVDGTIPIESLVVQTSLRETSQHSALVPEGVLRAEKMAD